MAPRVTRLSIWLSSFGLPLCLLLTFLLALGFRNSYQNWGDDWAQYILQGKAILSHSVNACVQQNAFMMRESARPPGPVAYPWGLPLLLAAEGLLFPFDLSTFKLFNILIFLLLVLAVHRLARRFVSESAALAVACMFGFNPLLLHYCNHVLTELPFTLASVCAFLAMEDSGDEKHSGMTCRLAAGALAFVAFTFRTNGILILAAATVQEFLPGPAEKAWRRPKPMELLAPYIPFVMLAVLWRMVFPAGGDGYGQMLRNISVDGLIGNARTYPVSLFDFFTGGHYSAILALLLGPVIIWGAVKSWRSTAHFTVYGLLTLGLYLAWPANQGHRFMIPVTPFLVILLMSGLDGVAPMLARPVQYGIPVMFLLGAVLLVGTKKLPRETWHPYDQPSSEMFQWIKDNTAGDSVISFFKPRAMHLLGERLCLTALPADVPKVSYLVYSKGLTWNAERPTLQQYQQMAALTPVFENRNFVVYRTSAKR